MRLTTKEKKIVQAILDSEYGDFATSPVWTRYLAEDAGLPKKSMGGIVSSLQRKRLVWTDAVKHVADMGTVEIIALTPAGVNAALAAGMTAEKLKYVADDPNMRPQE